MQASPFLISRPVSAHFELNLAVIIRGSVLRLIAFNFGLINGHGSQPHPARFTRPNYLTLFLADGVNIERLTACRVLEIETNLFHDSRETGDPNAPLKMW